MSMSPLTRARPDVRPNLPPTAIDTAPSGPATLDRARDARRACGPAPRRPTSRSRQPKQPRGAPPQGTRREVQVMRNRHIRAGLALFAGIAALVAMAPRAEAQSVRVAVIGDYGLAGADEASVAALIASWGPNFIVTTGDNNYYYGASSTIDQNIGQYYHNYISPYKGSYGAGATTNRFFPSLGNHDWEAAGAQPYLDYFTLPGNERYYDVVLGPIHFFMIDSDPSEPDGITVESAQASWLRGRLAASSARWKVVVFHHPPYSSGPHGSAPAMQWPFEAWGAHAVLNGHDHLYERVTFDDFPYFVNGLGGASRYAFQTPIEGSQVRYAADFGAMLVDADDQAMAFRFFTRSGALIDTYTLYASPSSHVPAAPSGLTAEAVSGSEIELTWIDNASNEADFFLESSYDGVNFSPSGPVARNSTHFPVSYLDPFRAYYFRLRARNAAGDSPQSNVAGATTMAPGLPAAPTGLTARPATRTQIDLAWTDASDNERGFSLERGGNGGAFAFLTWLPRNARAYSDAGLDYTVAYSYRLHAYNGYGTSGPSNIATSLTAVTDLVVTSLTGVPAQARPGESFAVTSTTRNQGAIASKAAVTRFYVVATPGGARTLLTGVASMSTLAPGQEAIRRTTVTIPSSTATGTYNFVGCADDRQVLVEFSEGNNCLTAASIGVGYPDLVISESSNPPGTILRGKKFSITDTVLNRSGGTAVSSKVRYYLTVSGAPETLLSGTRSIPALPVGQTSHGTASVGVPTSAVPGTYHVLVCADGYKAVRESDEGNNCRMTPGAMVVQ